MFREPDPKPLGGVSRIRGLVLCLDSAYHWGYLLFDMVKWIHKILSLLRKCWGSSWILTSWLKLQMSGLFHVCNISYSWSSFWLLDAFGKSKYNDFSSANSGSNAKPYLQYSRNYKPLLGEAPWKLYRKQGLGETQLYIYWNRMQWYDIVSKGLAIW